MPLLLGIVHAKSHRGGVRLRLDPLTIERMLTGAFRRQRMAQFARLFGVTNTTTILDIGGSTYIWSFLDIKPRVTCLNLEGNDPRPRREGNIELVSGDGRCLAYPDQSFDIAFSNSVIEHVGTEYDMHKLANEIRRVGKRYYVQTPNFWFPIDPHTYGVGNHWLPERWQHWAIKYTTPRAWLAKWTDDVIREYLHAIITTVAQPIPGCDNH